MTGPGEVSVVVPVFGNADTVARLHARIVAALGERLGEVVYVDDASPDGSAGVLAGLAGADDRVRVVSRQTNGGQHRALLDGLRLATGHWVVTIDADLQDPPEAIPELLAAGARGAAVVFAGRHGRYESAGRRLTSAAFKHGLGRVAGLPADASSFVAMRREVAAAVVGLDAGRPFLSAMIAATGAPTTSVPVVRARSASPSGYSSRARMQSGLRGLGWAVRARRMRDPAEHNRIQLEYYAGRDAPSIAPRRSRYVCRQVDAAIDFGGLGADQRLIDVGCGLGRATLVLADRGLQVEGLDLSPALLEGLRRPAVARGIVLHQGDLGDPPEAVRGSFDAVCGFFVLHHVGHLERAFAGTRLLLRPGGRIVFVEPNAFCPLFYAQIACVPGMSFAADGGVARMRPGALGEALAAAGFADVRMATFGFLPPAAVNRPRGAALERRLESVAPLAGIRAFRLIAARRA